MQTEAQKRASRKYDTVTTVSFHIKFNRESDAEIIKWIKGMENKNGYFRSLVQEDMRRNGASVCHEICHESTGAQ